MDMGLNEPWEQVSARGFDGSVTAVRFRVCSNRNDAPVSYDNVAADDVEPIVHRDDRGVPDDDGGGVGG
jgi:hypothetical protein